jgi:hypothetical protein
VLEAAKANRLLEVFVAVVPTLLKLGPVAARRLVIAAASCPPMLQVGHLLL